MARSSAQNPSRRSSRAAWLLLFMLPLALVAFAACGSDDPAAADAVTVSGDKLTWSPPWEAGDARAITIDSDVQLSPELQEMVDAFQQALDEDLEDEFDSATAQSIAGSVRFVSVSETGAVVEYDLPLDSLVDFITEADFENDDSEMLSAMVGLIGQLDLAIELSVDSSGAITGVTNIDELSTTIVEFVDSLMRLAELGGEDVMDAEERAQMEAFFSQISESELIAELAAGVMQTATGQMFLMRSGEYTVGQPVTVSENAPSAIGVIAPAQVTYLLKSVDDSTAVMDVTVASEGVDVIDYISTLIQEFAVMAGEDPSEAVDGLDEIPAEMQLIIDEISAMLFQPYTVTLTIDTETGWVTSTDWAMELAVPQSLIDQFESIMEFGGEPTIDFADIQATILLSSEMSPVATEQ